MSLWLFFYYITLELECVKNNKSVERNEFCLYDNGLNGKRISIFVTIMNLRLFDQYPQWYVTSSFKTFPSLFT